MMDRSGFGLGALAGLVGMACCVSPVILVLVGASSVAYAISLADTLYGDYGWHFRGAALLFAGLGLVWMLRRRQACTLSGARAHWRLALTVLVTMVVVYVALYGITTLLGRLAAA